MAQRLLAAGIAVPEPLAHFETEGGDEIVATRFLPGETLRTALACPAKARRELLARVAELVARLHATGVVHRDLHRENLWITPDGPVLIDLQQAVPVRARALRLRDLGELDASLAPLLSLADRVRLRAGALRLTRPFDADARRALRAVGRASEQRHRAHVESRTRRALRSGRLYARLACEAGDGMRLRSRSEEDARRTLTTTRDELAGPEANAEGTVLRFRSRALRTGSPARDAWLAGHGLRARGIGAPLPLAFVERRRPTGVTSAVWLESAQPAEASNDTAHSWRELLALGVALRRHHVAIASDAGLSRDANGALGPTRLEAVRFRPRLSREEALRIDALVHAALRNALPAEDEQRAALRRYALRVAAYDEEMVIQRK